jgi:hypothetical protein
MKNGFIQINEVEGVANRSTFIILASLKSELG